MTRWRRKRGFCRGRGLHFSLGCLERLTAGDGIDSGLFQLVFDIDEALLGSDVAPEITISLVSDPSVRTTGKVRQISPTIDETNGTVRVKVEGGTP